MPDQLIIDLGKNTMTEQHAYDILREPLCVAAHDMMVDPSAISCKRGQSFSSIYFGTTLICHLCFRGKKSHLEISSTLLPPLAKMGFPLPVKSSASFVKIPVATTADISGQADMICNAFRIIINRIPKEFDCCSRYLECSNAKKCIHPNPGISLGCGYRKVLASGRIFFGQNRNVD